MYIENHNICFIIFKKTSKIYEDNIFPERTAHKVD